MTVIEAIQEEAAKLGVVLSAKEADWVAWEHTGFPHFWPISEQNPTPEACLRMQVREWVEGLNEKAREAYRVRS